MTSYRIIYLIGLVILSVDNSKGLQRPPPRYSQQYMPRTSFTCHNKIIGSYYADPETDCQLFHVCVSVAGSVQDYRFLCPNDTAFDQESQTCADWYDVDCEAATLYYASDNFDLYRIGSGLESLHYDNIRNDFEPQDHLQRSESNDPIRSPINPLKSSSHNDSKKLKKDNKLNNENYSSTKLEKQSNIDSGIQPNLPDNQESRKKNTRKINNKYFMNEFTNEYIKSTIPTFTLNRINDKLSNKSQTTASIPIITQNIINLQKSYQFIPTVRPAKDFASTVRSVTITRNTVLNDTASSLSRSSDDSSYFNKFEISPKSTNVVNTSYLDIQSRTSKLNNFFSFNERKPNLDYQNTNHGNNQEKKLSSYDEINKYNRYSVVNNGNQTEYLYKKSDSSIIDSTIPSLNIYTNKIKVNINNDDYHFIKKTNDNNSKVNTVMTHSPSNYDFITKKSTNNKQYEKSIISTTESIRYDRTDTTKPFKKDLNDKEYQIQEIDTKNYDLRKSVELGFSPSSINYLAESFKTTPNLRRNTTPTTYNPNNLGLNTYTSQRKSTYNSHHSTKNLPTLKVISETSTVINKKNDYDYAYYDNGPLEYENIELEHVNSNKESVKIT